MYDILAIAGTLAILFFAMMVVAVWIDRNARIRHRVEHVEQASGFASKES